MGVGIIVAGGSGKRFGKADNKVFAELGKKTLLEHCVKAFDSAKTIEYMIIVAKQDEWNQMKSIPHEKEIKFTEGGNERMHSVLNGLRMVEEDTIVAVHNGANPNILPVEIDLVVTEAEKHGGAIAGFPVVDTLKRTDDNDQIQDTVERKNAWHAQTPQAGMCSKLIEGYEKAISDGITATDEGMALEILGIPVKMVECRRINTKVTYPSDLPLLEKSLNAHKIGYGKDTHLFEENKELVLSGVTIPHSSGMKGNSDGDAVLHAVSTAMLQAIGGFSLGSFTDKWCKEEGITDSKVYLKRFSEFVKQSGNKVMQIGVMIEAMQPKLDKHIEEMKKTLANTLQIPVSNIGMSATSGEGTNKGLTAYATAWLAPWNQEQN